MYNISIIQSTHFREHCRQLTPCAWWRWTRRQLTPCAWWRWTRRQAAATVGTVRALDRSNAQRTAPGTRRAAPVPVCPCGRASGTDRAGTGSRQPHRSPVGKPSGQPFASQPDVRTPTAHTVCLVPMDTPTSNGHHPRRCRSLSRRRHRPCPGQIEHAANGTRNAPSGTRDRVPSRTHGHASGTDRTGTGSRQPHRSPVGKPTGQPFASQPDV